MPSSESPHPASPASPDVSRRAGGRTLPALVAAALLAVVFFFSPHFWIMREPMPGSYEWSRALGYLRQCEAPFTRDVEPALHWRLLPPLVAHSLGLEGRWAFLLPWAGIVAFMSYAAVLLRRALDDWRWILGGLLVVGSTSAVLVPLHWLGINDAWIWLALLVVAFSPSSPSIALACLLAPWVDERFLLAFPLAWACGRAHAGEPVFSRAVLQAAWLLPYAAARLSISAQFPAERAAAGAFVATHLVEQLKLLPIAPLAWWMGLRAAWLPACLAFAGQRREHVVPLALGTFIATGSAFFLAADLSRSISVLTPLVMLGLLRHARSSPDGAARRLLILGGVALLLPAMHVVHQRFAPVAPLPVELLRLLGQGS